MNKNCIEASGIQIDMVVVVVGMDIDWIGRDTLVVVVAIEPTNSVVAVLEPPIVVAAIEHDIDMVAAVVVVVDGYIVLGWKRPGIFVVMVLVGVVVVGL